VTAEIAVLNRMGIALAADSAVTIGGTQNKIYSSVDKLFQLSDSAPVGIMVYGSADIAFMPWEVIIKAYRSTLGRARYDVLDGYADNFIDYLENNRQLLSEQAQENSIHRAATHFFRRIKDEYKKALNIRLRSGAIGATEAASIFSDLISKKAAELAPAKPLAGLPPRFPATMVRRYDTQLSEAIDGEFAQLPRSKTTVRLLKRLFADCFSKENSWSSHSGIVVAGYGESQ